LDYEVIIVDDGSPDNTAEVARQLQVAYPNRVILKERAGKLGLGTAYVHGRKYIPHEGYSVFNLISHA
jgi:dolichol-phosphate mannosyltransferase